MVGGMHSIDDKCSLSSTARSISAKKIDKKKKCIHHFEFNRVHRNGSTSKSNQGAGNIPGRHFIKWRERQCFKS